MKKEVIKLIVVSLCLLYASSEICAQGRILEFESPKLKVFLPPKSLANGKAVVACPGGGYSHLAVDNEGYRWAPYFNNLGIAYAVLEYKLPKGNPDIPMKDVEAAFKILSDSASIWQIDSKMIGIMGSSAGGHLASTVSTHPRSVCSPAFQILFYPVISLDEAVTHMDSKREFLGDNPPKSLVDEWSNEKKVTASTPRAFLALSGDDKVVNPVNSILYFSALQNAGVSVSMFIYSTGGHGWGYRNNFKYHQQMLYELTTWLTEF
jgi:acetyl esterase/lipase